jgi:signal transduction histidine kinase
VKNIFCRTTSQEIRSPLTTAFLGCQLLKNELQSFSQPIQNTNNSYVHNFRNRDSSDVTGDHRSSGRSINDINNNYNSDSNSNNVENCGLVATSARADDVVEVVDYMKFSLTRSLALVNDMLTYCKIEDGTIVAEKKTILLYGLLKKTSKSYEAQVSHFVSFVGVSG